MPQEYHRFDKGKIIDNTTVSGMVDGRSVDISVVEGLPDNTFRVTVRKDSRPDGSVVIGAFIHGRDFPMTVVGRIKENAIGRN